MLKLIFIITLVLATVFADKDFVVLHSPSSLEVEGGKAINQSLLREVLTGVIGYRVREHDWKGVYIKNIFDLPEAVVIIAIEDVESVNSPYGTRFPLYVDELEETTWQVVCRVVEGNRMNNTLIRMRVGDGLTALGHSALGELNPNSIDKPVLKYLDLENNVDRDFIEEIQLLRAIAKKVPSTIIPNSNPDVYWFVVCNLRPLIDSHKDTPLAVDEAFRILNEALDDLSVSFVDAYKGNVFIAAFTSDTNAEQNDESETSIRVRREEQQEKSDSSTENPRDATSSSETIELKDANLAKKYSANYPVIFNIFLWFGVTFLFSLIAICIAIAEMDPGRDSIIYRMTSNRMKKDN
ncbi:ATPase H(+)-transporting accessory protein 2 isoform X2 [Chelonus insularis]|uniref:ATPase H(+)-transporting accessory protein 2 isoform X2 n=1 Tax=Chelonus insularis TaxID=460826 RepID=UPI00158D7B0A|nr:ATPase H(+)-transporting accessory protein 2 isoform X2 [Chelonus insularis]